VEFSARWVGICGHCCVEFSLVFPEWLPRPLYPLATFVVPGFFAAKEKRAAFLEGKPRWL
jgi:hypothetical protein